MTDFNEKGFRGEDAEGVFVLEIRKEQSDKGVISTTIVVRANTVTATGDGVRSISKDITSSFNSGQLNAVTTILAKGIAESKIIANIA